MSRRIQSFSIPIMGKPIVWSRTATLGDGTRVNPQRYRDWKRHAKDVLQAGAGYRTFRGEVAVDIELHPDRVTVAVEALDDERRAGTGLQGDVDNYAKAVLDALQAGEVLTDDKTVAQLTVRIHPAKPSRPAGSRSVREATTSLTDRYKATLEELA